MCVYILFTYLTKRNSSRRIFDGPVTVHSGSELAMKYAGEESGENLKWKCITSLPTFEANTFQREDGVWVSYIVEKRTIDPKYGDTDI